MAAQFCMKCGTQLPAGAQFCSGCGNPTGAASAGAAPATPAAPVVASPAPPATGAAPAFTAPPLGATLGLGGSRNFLLQHQLLSGGRNYRVLNHEKRHLFTVREDVRQEMVSNLLGRAAAPEQGFHMGFVQPPTHTFAWTVADSSGNPQGSITIQVTGNTTVSTLADSGGSPVVAVNVQRSMVGGLSATAAFPDGRSMFTAHGNLLRHNFAILDPAGAEVAKFHEAWASVRDTYNLDLVSEVDPLCPIIFAILIDREKQS